MMFIYKEAIHQKKNINIPDIIVVHCHQTQQPAGTLQKAEHHYQDKKKKKYQIQKILGGKWKQKN